MDKFMVSENKNNNRKLDKKILIIFMIMFTEILGFSIVMPVIPFLGLSLGLNAVQIGFVLSIFSFCQLFASPITGKLSDRFGRKPILIFSQLSTLTGFLLLGMSMNVWILVAARLVDGLLGSNMTVSQAYLSDITTAQNRTRVYGYSSAVFGLALIFGPVIGGTLSVINYSVPMFLAAGVSLLSIILVIIFLPESLTEKNGKLSLRFEDIFPINEAKRFFKSSMIRSLLLIFFIYNFGFFIFISSFSLFAEQQLAISAQQLGFYLTWIGFTRVLFQTFLIDPLLKKTSENTLLLTGIISLIFSMVFLAFTTNFLVVFFPLFFLSYGTGVGRPILTSKLTKTVKREETGSILGVNNSLTSIGQIFSPILGGLIIQFLPSVILPLTSGTVFVLIFLLWGKAFKKPKFDKKEKIDLEILQTEFE
jgi:DHA1 family tetracycline resistance protein-like MFS transporter